MLFAGTTRTGTHLWPKWWAYLFGGRFAQTYCARCGSGGGYGWRPNLWRMWKNYSRGGGSKMYSFWEYARIYRKLRCRCTGNRIG